MALRFGRNSGATISAASFVRGPQGAAATLDVGTTSALAAGATPTVTNSGDTNDAIFNFGIPRGADSGIKWLFDSSTTMADPGTGDFRLNHATLASVTAIAVSATGSGSDVSDYVATWDDSTNTTKGYVVLREEAGGTAAVFSISAVTDNTAWLQLTVTYVSGSLSLTAADPVYFVPLMTGNKGLDGEVAGPVSSTTGGLASYADTSGASLADSGVLAANVVQAASAFATDNVLIRADGTGRGSQATGISVADSTNDISGTGFIKPASNDGGALGDGTHAFSDLFLASGGVINFNNGAMTVTHSTGDVALAGGSLTLPNTGLHLLDTDSSHDLIVVPGSNLTADRTLTITTGDANRTLTLTADSSIGGTAAILAGNQNLTGGFTTTSYDAGTKSSGTFTPDPTLGNMQHATNNGAHTLAPPGSTCTMVIDYTNGASAGALTTSGFTKVSGDTYATTNTYKFRLFVSVGNAGSHLSIQAIQ